MKNKIRIGFLLVAVSLVAGCFASIPAEAGTITTAIGEESYEKEIDNTIWNNPDGDVVVESEKLIFPNESTETTRLITKAGVVQTEQVEKLFAAQFTMNFSKLPEGKEFIFAMGLSSIESLPGDQGNLEIAFMNKGGLHVKVTEYADETKELVKEKKCGSIQNAKVAIDFTSSGNLSVKVNGAVVGECKPSVSGEGSVGFLQTGDCGVQISDVNLSMYQYDRPQNSNVTEDFESGDFDASVFASRMTQATEYYPSTIAIEEYNGSQVLMFRNVGQGYLITKQQYSNFELIFELPYIQVDEEKDADGNTITPTCDSFGVSFGGNTGGNDPVVNFDEATDLLLFMGNGVMGYKSDHPMRDAKKHLYRESDENIAVFKVSVIDENVSVAIKWKGEADSTYETILAYKTSGVKTGYVGIWAPSGRSSTFAIDNIKLTNLDIDANLVEIERVSSKVEVPEDYDYKPEKKIYREVKKQTGSIPMEYAVIGGVAGACVLAIVITVVVTTVNNKKKKRGAENEK